MDVLDGGTDFVVEGIFDDHAEAVGARTGGEREAAGDSGFREARERFRLERELHFRFFARDYFSSAIKERRDEGQQLHAAAVFLREGQLVNVHVDLR